MNLKNFVEKYNKFYKIPNPVSPSKENLKGQCVSLILQYVRQVLETNIENFTGNAIEWWTHADKYPLKNYFEKISFYENLEFKKGDIIIIDIANDEKYEHIALSLGEQNKKEILIFDSNYNNNKTCLKRWRSKNGVIGILRPKDFLKNKIENINNEKIDLRNYVFKKFNTTVKFLKDTIITDVEGNEIYKAYKDTYLPLNISVNKTSQVINGYNYIIVILPDFNWGYLKEDNNIEFSL